MSKLLFLGLFSEGQFVSVVKVEGGSDDSQINTDPKENGPINTEQTNHSPGITVFCCTYIICWHQDHGLSIYE